MCAECFAAGWPILRWHHESNLGCEVAGCEHHLAIPLKDTQIVNHWGLRLVLLGHVGLVNLSLQRAVEAVGHIPDLDLATHVS